MKKVFREISADEFAKFTAVCPVKNFMQSPAMYQRYQATGQESYLLGGFDGDTLVVAGIARKVSEKFGHKIFAFSCGPLADYAKHLDDFYSFLSSAQQFLKGKGGIALQITPFLLAPHAPADFASRLKSLGFKYLGEYDQAKWVYAIDFQHHASLPHKPAARKRSTVFDPPLSAEETQALLSSFRRDHRATIRHATERYGLTVRELPVTEYQTLLDMIKEAGEYHGFAPRDIDFFRQIKEFFQDDAIAIVAEMPDGKPVAAAFFLLYGDEVIYLFSGFSREHRKLGGPHLIQWTMIQYAYANGYRQYNFWGTNPDPNDGVHQFKQGFHGEEQEFVGAYIAPLTLAGRLYTAKLQCKEQRDL